MIKDKCSFINDVDETNCIFSDDVESIKFYRCPRCGSYHVVRNGTYTRKTIINKEESKITIIQKYLCRECNTSFKYLPLYLSPYSHLSIITLFKVIIDFSSIRSISLNLDISRSSIRNIKERFKDTLNKLIVLFNKVTINSFKELFDYYFIEFREFLFASSTTLARYSYQVNHLS